MSADMPATPLKPRKAATRARTKKVTAQLSMKASDSNDRAVRILPRQARVRACTA
jgi:hypothetical protein